MSYNNWLRAEDIPTIRRLDYVVEGTDNMESGYLYAKFRKMSGLSLYNNLKLTAEEKSAEFEFGKKIIQDNLVYVNDWMITNNREIIFTDINDWRAIGTDYDYFWELRTKDQFAKEEAEARLGLSSRTPVNLDFDSCPSEHNIKLRELIEKYEEEIKQGMASSEE